MMLSDLVTLDELLKEYRDFMERFADGQGTWTPTKDEWVQYDIVSKSLLLFTLLRYVPGVDYQLIQRCKAYTTSPDRSFLEMVVGMLARADANATKRPTVVCLCGSTRFGDAFHEAALRETLAGRIVLSIGVDTKSDADLLLAGEISPEDKARLDELHLRKIDLADEVLILNVGNYIGTSTKHEMAYAMRHGKRIRLLEYDGLNIYSTSEVQWIEAYLGERITEGVLATVLDVDRVEARMRVEQYKDTAGRQEV